MTKTLASFFTFLLLLFIFAISEIEAVEEASKLIENLSTTYSGKCNDEACDKKCLSWEGAVHGACHVREDKFGCFCYYNSYKDKSPSLSGYGSAPPPKAKSPSPPKGGKPHPPKGHKPHPPKGGKTPPPSSSPSAPPSSSPSSPPSSSPSSPPSSSPSSPPSSSPSSPPSSSPPPY